MKALVAFVYLVTGLALVSCSSKRTIRDDRLVIQNNPLMRIIIDETVDATTYRQLQTALMQSGLYEIVDRSSAFQAIEREKRRQHRELADQFSNEEKYALYGELFGAGAVCSAFESTLTKYSVFSDQYRKDSTLFLSLVSTTSGKVIAAIRDEQVNSEMDIVNWDDAVVKLNNALPKNISEIEIQYTDRMKAFRKDAKYRAEREQSKNWRILQVKSKVMAEESTGEPLR